MQKLLAILILIGVVFGVILLKQDSSRAPIFSTGSSEDAQYIEKATMSFLEDLRFKDYKKAASYHSVEDQKNADIPKLIEDVFKVKPELLDILRYEILKVELDSTKTRGKVKTKTVIRLLNTDQIEEPEIIFYWEKTAKDGWTMRLHTSLQ